MKQINNSVNAVKSSLLNSIRKVSDMSRLFLKTLPPISQEQENYLLSI